MAWTDELSTSSRDFTARSVAAVPLRKGSMKLLARTTLGIAAVALSLATVAAPASAETIEAATPAVAQQVAITTTGSAGLDIVAGIVDGLLRGSTGSGFNACHPSPLGSCFEFPL